MSTVPVGIVRPERSGGAKLPRLRRVDSSEPGITRVRRGRGFAYVDASGKVVSDREELERIRGLAIPPAWKDVWICPQPNGHLQAVGTDAAGRKQYLYHPAWRERRDQAKFQHMIEFGRALPRLRKVTSRHLDLEGFPRERVLACSVRLLDIGFFRVGSEDYAEQNRTFGLATIERRHASLDGDLITFDYVSKGGKRRIQSVVDPDVAEVIRGLKRRRGGGPELLAYRDGRRWRDVRSQDINDYIKEITGEEFTAKDFRTWNATVLAALSLAMATDGATSRTARKRTMAGAVREVAEFLGNTPAVCRASYIDPRVFDRFRGGITIRRALGEVERVDPETMPMLHGKVEEAVLELLEDQTPAPARAA
jgi:DNA topoisomerase I